MQECLDTIFDSMEILVAAEAKQNNSNNPNTIIINLPKALASKQVVEKSGPKDHIIDIPRVTQKLFVPVRATENRVDIKETFNLRRPYSR